MLTIPEDVFGEFTETSRERVKEIFTALNEQVFKVAKNRYSWKLTHDKDGLTKEFTTRIKQQQERYLNDDKHRVQSLEEDIRQYTKALKDKYDSRIRLLGNIETAMTRINAVQEKLIKDLDNIINHPKVVDLVIKDGKFIVTTAPLYMYHDRTGEKYFLGDMRIEMNPQNTEVRFYNISNRRKSYWSSQDNHPHVGENGGACLGNVGATIAELCSQMELYALTLVGIDFLESTNTSDPAGKNIVNWDKVDEEGNIIEPEPDWTCDECGNGMRDSDDRYRVYESYTGDRGGNGEYGEERFVCEHCTENTIITKKTLMNTFEMAM
jgi:hypothetical protein